MISLLLMVLTSIGSAQQCETLNKEMAQWFLTENVNRDGIVTSEPPIEKRMGPIRNQRSTLWCWGFATADFVSYHLRQQVSVAQIVAITQKGGFFSRRDSNSRVTGNYMTSALEAIKGKGLCTERQIPFYTHMTGDLKTALTCKSPSLSTSGLRFKKVVNFPPVKNDLLRVIDSALAKGQIVGIEYNMAPLVSTYNPQFGLVSNAMLPHASNVVSRFFNPKSNQCEYLVRNSWGESCLNYKGACAAGYHSVSKNLLDKIVYHTITRE